MRRPLSSSWQEKLIRAPRREGPAGRQTFIDKKRKELSYVFEKWR